MEPLPIPLIKEAYNGKSDEDFVGINVFRDPMYITLDLYEFKMSWFDHGKTEEFFYCLCATSI